MESKEEKEELNEIINNIYRLIIVQTEALSVLGTEFNRQCQIYADKKPLIHERRKAFTGLKKQVADFRRQLDIMTENSFKYVTPDEVVKTADNLLENGREWARLSTKWASVTNPETIKKIENLLDEDNCQFLPKSITDRWKLNA